MYFLAVGIEDSCGVNVAMSFEVCIDDVVLVIVIFDGLEIFVEIV